MMFVKETGGAIPPRIRFLIIILLGLIGMIVFSLTNSFSLNPKPFEKITETTAAVNSLIPKPTEESIPEVTQQIIPTRIYQNDIVFRDITSDRGFSEKFEVFTYYLLTQSQYVVIGEFRGSPAWSPDGQFLAVSCEDDIMAVCILDLSGITEDTSGTTEVLKRIGLPQQCEGLISEEMGLISISWSYTGEEISVICGTDDFNSEKEVCIISVDNSGSYCWEDVSPNLGRVVWSPVDDLLLVSTLATFRPKIYLVNPDGENPQYLTDGWDAVWSPDGQQIAFEYFEDEFFWFDDSGIIHFIDGKYDTRGIAVINRDGSGFDWLYKNVDPLAPVINLPKHNNGGGLSWSQDRNYIAFVQEIGMGPTYIYQLDLQTLEISCISCELEGDANSKTEPIWRP